MKKPPQQPPNSEAIARLGPSLSSLPLHRKAFPLEPGSSIAAVVIRELSGYDDEEISRGVTLGEGTSMLAAGRLLQREALRRSIVGYWTTGGAWVEAQQPLADLDGWTIKTHNQLNLYFGIVNGNDDADLKKAAAAALEWQPGDGAPSWPGSDASAASTGSDQPRSD